MIQKMLQHRYVNLLQEFSIPLIMGVICALIWANIDHHSYHAFLHHKLLPGVTKVDFHFLMNDIFMVFFFGIAGVEITQSVLPGGDLNPPSKAVGPLFATVGGVIGPALTYVALCYVFGVPSLVKGWGVPTATDIALAWLVARFVFGKAHPAVSFLLLLAIVDDAIGLGIIAIFYPDPSHPAQPIFLLITVLGMALSFGLRKLNVQNFWLYLLIGGLLSWYGLLNAGLHPALALVFIVPFMPHSTSAGGHIFEDDQRGHSTLTNFEHSFKTIVDFGLFGFGLANAGVSLSGVSEITWVVLAALLVGKTAGIWLFSALTKTLRIPLPEGMGLGDCAVAGMVAGLGLTVALFVAGVAFTDTETQGAAKMGALLSVLAAPLAFMMAKFLGVKRRN